MEHRNLVNYPRPSKLVSGNRTTRYVGRRTLVSDILLFVDSRGATNKTTSHRTHANLNPTRTTKSLDPDE